jgi:cell division protein FtsB
MTIQEIISAINALDTENKALKAEIADLKTKLPPTGIVKIILTDVDMSKVTFS